MVWKPDPDAPVATNERIGRRIFGGAELRGASDQPNLAWLKATHFHEKRAPIVSVDRLGKTGVDKQVTRYLSPRCGFAATRLRERKPFAGWAHVQAKALMAPVKGQSISISPAEVKQEGEQPFTDNPYHAHIIRPQPFEHFEDPAWMMAVFLQTIFEAGSFESVEEQGAGIASDKAEAQGVFAAVVNWLRGLFKT